MNVYQWAIQLRDMMSPALQRAQATYNRFGQGWQQMTARLPRGMNMARQSVDQLRSKLDGLTRRRDLSIDTRDIRRANREIAQVEGQIARLTGRGGGGSGGGGIGGGIMGIVKQFLPALGIAGAVAAGGAFAKSGMDREQTKVGFEQFVGKDGVNPMMAQLNRFADVTPYSNEDVYKSGRSLLSAHVDPNHLTEKMTNIGNLSAVAQKDFGEMSQTYAKIKQKGFIDGGELHQEFGGTALMSQLKKNLKVGGDDLFKMAEQRKIKFADVDKAIADLSAKGGLYEGGLDKLSKTAGGKLSTFLGTLGNKVTEWAEKLNPFLSNLFDFGSDFLSKIGVLEDAVGNLFSAFAPLWDSIKGIAEMFGFAGKNGSILETVINLIAGAINTLAFVVSAFTSPLGQLFLVGLGVYKLFTSWPAMLMGVINMVTKLKAAVQSLMVFMAANPATVWIVALGALVVALKYAWDNFDGFREMLLRVWAVAKSVFSSIGTAWKALMSGDFSGIAKAFGDAWKNGMKDGDAAVAADRAARAKKPAAKAAASPHKFAYAEEKEYGSKDGKGGKKKSTKDASGVDGAVSGAKSTNITINLKSLVEHLTINANGMADGMANMEEQVKDTLLRVLNSANSVAS